MKNSSYPILKGAVNTVAGVSLMLAILFLPAGTLHWPEAWILVTAYLISVAAVVLWLKRNDPELLKERRAAGRAEKGWDKAIMRIYSLLLVAMLVLSGLDAVRFQWSRLPPVVKICGFLALMPSILIGFWAMRVNTYLSPHVRIQKERGHRVCSSGPYRYVRHPMYAAGFPGILGLPLALGSLYALIPAVLIVGLFTLRTHLEDRLLHEELEGYREYAENVRFRLFPGIW